MATKYVRKSGSDSNGGTSPSDAWLTIGKALGASGIASGDTVWIGAGTYRETFTVAMTSATVTTHVAADLDGTHTGDAGEVVWTAYTTNDTTAPAASPCVTLSARDFLSFEGVTFIGGNHASGCVDAATATSTDTTFVDCTFVSFGLLNVSTNCINILVGANVNANWLIDRCRFFSVGQAVTATLATSASADYDCGITIQNSVMVSGFKGVNVLVSAALSFKGGGLDVRACTILCGGGNGVHTNGASLSTSIPCTVTDSLVFGTICLIANTSGQITESNNRLVGPTARTNVTAGTGSVGDNSQAVMVEIGQSFPGFRRPRPFLTPMAGSPLLRFGNAASPLSVDVLNRLRPSSWGAAADNAAGAFERHDTAISPGTTVGARTGSGYNEIVGPGDQEFDVPVDAVAQTFSIYFKTSGYGGTTYPRMSIVGGSECGVSDQNADATSASGSAYEQVSIGPFTPTAKGVVTVRFINRTTNSGGIVAYDDFTVA